MSRKPHNRSASDDPQWRPAGHYFNDRLHPKQRHWLLDDASLTQRLLQRFDGQFRVQRLAQHWAAPRPSEARLLQLPPGQLALVREVALLGRGQPVVFARSLFPIATLSGRLRYLRRLRNQSLGALLFRYPNMQRSPFELARLPANSAYIPADLAPDETVWARRCRFEIDGLPLSVSEVFLQPLHPGPTGSRLRSSRGRIAPGQ